jgi:hypothetical protein
MPELRFNFDDLDEDAMERRERDTGAGSNAPTKPGPYPGKIVSMNTRTQKNDGSATKDIHVVAEITEGPHEGWRGQKYFNVEFDGDTGAVKKEMYYQLLNALGIATTSKTKGKFRTENIEGKPCTLVVRMEPDNRPEFEGVMRAKLDRLLKPGLTKGNGAAAKDAESDSDSGGSDDDDLPF